MILRDHPFIDGFQAVSIWDWGYIDFLYSLTQNFGEIKLSYEMSSFKPTEY